MSGASWALQQAVYAALTGDAALTALIGGRVFDAVPPSPVFPYLVLAEARETAAGSGLAEHSLTLHVWSRGSGARESKQIAAAASAVLDGAALPLDRYLLVNLQFLSAEYTRQSDGQTWRGLLRFRAVTEAPTQGESS